MKIPGALYHAAPPDIGSEQKKSTKHTHSDPSLDNRPRDKPHPSIGTNGTNGDFTV